MTTTPTALDALIADLEAAKEGSRELDARIALTVYPMLLEFQPDLARGPGHWLSPEAGPVFAQHYSTSLDAALTLVPEGLYGKIGFGPNRANARIWLVTQAAVNASIKVPDPALALCIAALRARKSMMDE